MDARDGHSSGCNVGELLLVPADGGAIKTHNLGGHSSSCNVGETLLMPWDIVTTGTQNMGEHSSGCGVRDLCLRSLELLFIKKSRFASFSFGLADFNNFWGQGLKDHFDFRPKFLASQNRFRLIGSYLGVCEDQLFGNMIIYIMNCICILLRVTSVNRLEIGEHLLPFRVYFGCIYSPRNHFWSPTIYGHFGPCVLGPGSSDPITICY